MDHYKHLAEQVAQRDWTEDRQAMHEMAEIYEGKLPAAYEQFFPRNTPKHLVQVINLAWDDLATQVGRIPDLTADPRNLTRQELKAAGLLERIGHWTLNNAKPTGKLFMRQLGWWMQLGRAVAIVEPDHANKMPRLALRDARTCYPGIKESANNTIVELSDIIFKHEIPFQEAVRRGLAHPHRQQPTTTFHGQPAVTVYERIDDQTWTIASETHTKIAEHNLGIVPGWVFQTFTPNGKAGKSRFRDQISLMIAMSRLITAKMAFADRLVHPIMWAKGHEGTIEIGPVTINKLGPQGELGQVAPPRTLQVDQDIQLLNSFSRILNRNPAARQGEIQARGQYTSAKTLEQLADAIDTVVGGDWDIIGPGLQHLLKASYMMLEKNWPDHTYSISGTVNNTRFADEFTPAENIAGRHNIRVEYGFGTGGYQGFLMHLQAGQADLMSRRRVMENIPGVSDVDKEMQTIDIENMDKAGRALFQRQAEAGNLDMLLWADIRQKMATKGLPLHEAMLQYEERIREQAAAAAAAEQAALAAPAITEPEPDPNPPGLPPQALAAV